MGLFAWRGVLALLFGPAQQMSVALPLLVVENIVTAIAVDYDEAIEVGAEYVVWDSLSAGTGAGANGVIRDVLIGEHPQPGVDGFDSPTGLINMDDVGFAERVDEQLVGRPRQVREPLFGADESGRADRDIAMGLEEITDLAIGNAQAVFEFGPMVRTQAPGCCRRRRSRQKSAQDGGLADAAGNKDSRADPCSNSCNKPSEPNAMDSRCQNWFARVERLQLYNKLALN